MSVFRNLLTQLFDKGGLPSEYQRVEWIAGTSTTMKYNAIDTGIKMQPNIEITIGASWNQSFNASYDRLAGLDKLGWMEASSNSPTICLYPTGQGTYSNALTTTRSEVKITTTYWSVDGTTIKTYTAPSFGNTTIILDSNTTGQYTYGGRFSIWDCMIKVGDDIVFNAVPCYRKSDNEIGMYDFVSQTFITSSGAGTFIKGGDI